MTIKKVWLDDENIFVTFDSGHTIGNPLLWFPRLKNATPEQRNNFEISPFGIHWASLDEDLSIEGLLTYKWDISPVATNH